MRLIGIISEYNPFHLGHAHHLRLTRERHAATHIVAVMSGNLVQRGEPPLLSKHRRAEMALMGGADLVLELPAPFSGMGAERFALGGVSALMALGRVDAISFGSESGEIEPIRRVAEFLTTEAFSAGVRPLLMEGMSFAKARQLSVADALGDAHGGLLATPNNALGVEYLKAMIRLGAGFSAVTIPRQGAGHDASQAAGGFASASKLRELLRAENLTEARRFMPPHAADILAEAMDGGQLSDPRRIESALLHQLRRMGPADFRDLPDISEGWEHRLAAAAKNAATLTEFTTLAASRRVTLARARRAAIHAALGMRGRDLPGGVPYLRILGMNRRGEEILAAIKGSVSVPLSASPAKLRETSAEAGRTVALESAATDLFWLATKSGGPCGKDFTERPVMSG